MPDSAVPQPDPVRPLRPSKRSVAGSQSGSAAAEPEPAEESALFRALTEAGFGEVAAYTVEKRIRAMTSETAALQVQPVLAQLREMRENMVTKTDLAEFGKQFATKTDLIEFGKQFATKTDLIEFGKQFATKTDLIEFGKQFATKTDLANLETRLTRWMFGALMAQAMFIVAVVIGFVSLML